MGNILTTISYALVQIGWGISIFVFAFGHDQTYHDAFLVIALSVMAAAVELATAIKSGKATLTINFVKPEDGGSK